MIKACCLRGLPLTSMLWVSSEDKLALKQFQQLITNAIKLAGNAEMGLDFGRRLTFTGDGVLGLGPMACNTLMESLHFACRTTTVLNPQVEWKMEAEDEYVRITIEEAIPWKDLQTFMVDTSLSVISTMVRHCSAEAADQVRFFFKYEPANDIDVYATSLSSELNFQSHFNGVLIPLECCSAPMPISNPTAVRKAEKALADQIEYIGNQHLNLLRPIQQWVANKKRGIPTNQEVADLFHISSRTLNRRLNAAGTTFKDVIAEVRHNLAVEYLCSDKHSIDEISDLLGYSNSSSFGKAFKGWSGMSPSHYRREFQR